jgi:hypothetical protein
MLTVLTVLDASYPLFSLTPTPAMATREDCIPFIFPCDINLRDNCSFHHHSWSSMQAQELISSLGAEYKLLPKYWPEFTPSRENLQF